MRFYLILRRRDSMISLDMLHLMVQAEQVDLVASISVVRILEIFLETFLEISLVVHAVVAELQLRGGAAEGVAEQLVARFGCKAVAITLRTSLSAFDNLWAGMIYTGRKAFFSKEYALHIVDRVGGGDSFGGGLIHALLAGKSAQKAIDFAVAASALKHSIEHDFNHVSVAEVETLAAGNGTGRVQR